MFFLLGRRFNNPLGAERKCRFLQVFIPYVKTGWKNAIDYRFGPERGFMSEKSLPSILCKGRKGLQSGDSAKKSVQTMLLVGKVPLQEGEKKIQSAMFFTIFCRWGWLERRGKNLW